MKESIAIVIVTFNKKNDVAKLLTSLFEMDREDFDYRLIVVDNASSDGTVEYIQEKYGSRVEILAKEANTGGTGGFNSGMTFVLEETDCSYIWLLDNDVVVAADAVTHLLTLLRSRSDVGLVGSAMLKMNAPEIVQEIGGYIDWDIGKLVHLHHNRRICEVDTEAMEVGFCAAASLLVRRTVLEDVGLWSDFFIHFDDIEWCYRIQKSGWKIYAHPLSLIWHQTFETKPVSWIRYYDTRNFLYLYDLVGRRGKSRKMRRFFLHRCHLNLLGLKRKAWQIRQGVKDYRNGILGKREAIPIHDFQDISELRTILQSSKGFHLVAPNLVELEEMLQLFPDGLAKGRKALLYEKADTAKISSLESSHGLRIISRKGRISGWFLLTFWHTVLRALWREYSVLHSAFIDRKCFPHMSRRCFLYPQAQGFIDD